MTKRRTPASYRTRDGRVVDAGGAHSRRPVISEEELDVIFTAYDIATYTVPRTREAWRAALDALRLPDDRRAAVAARLEGHWQRGPYDPSMWDPQTVYPPGRAPLLIFTPG